MKELLLQVFNLEDPETAAPPTADRSILLPQYWIRMHHEWRECYFRPDDASSPVDGLLSDCFWVIGIQCSSTLVTLRRLTQDIKMDGQTSRCLVEVSSSVRTQEVPLVTNGLATHCLFLLIDRLLDIVTGVNTVLGRTRTMTFRKGQS